MDYISEANKFMYDDNYITEAKFEINGKQYTSKDAAEKDLIKKGLKGTKLADALKPGKFAEKSAKEPKKSKHADPDEVDDELEKSLNVESDLEELEYDPDDNDRDHMKSNMYDKRGHDEAHQRVEKSRDEKGHVSHKALAELKDHNERARAVHKDVKYSRDRENDDDEDSDDSDNDD